VALRTKTIEYAFATDTATLAAAARRDLAAITLYIPETSSRTFRSVIVEVNVRGDETVAASMTSWLIGIKLGAAAFNDVTTTLTLTNTGDQQSHVFTRDVTSYFTTNFGAGGSQTCQVGLQFGALATANHTVKIIITYEYDDASATTRVKTVRIPLESNTAQLTATLANIGTTQIPLLDTFLPESSKVYRRIWMEFWFNDGGNATTDFSLGVALTGGTTIAEVAIYRCEQALNTAVFGKAHWDLGALVTSATANLQARSNATASRFSLLGAVLYVTYEYDHSASTTILNSLVLAGSDETGWPGNTAAGDRSRFERIVWIEEPGTITLAQSGFLCFISDPGTVTLNVLAGSQTARAYALTAGSAQSGPYVFTHRIDSGSGGGAFGTLARGRNLIDVDRYSTVASAGSNFSVLLFLNYTSDKHADGDGAHAHSTCWSICEPANALTTQRNIAAPTALFNIPETNYYLVGLAFEVLGVMVGAAASGLVLQAERQSAEDPGAGWVDFATALIRSDAELGVQWSIGATREEWDRWPTDPDSYRMAIETTRQYRICSVTTMTLGVRAWLTYHGITFTVSGNVTGSSGGTVNIDVFRTASGEKIGSTSRVGNGAWSFTWYDNTENVFAAARESASLLGRSDDGLAT
jgi:hypothetical protein